MLMWVKLQSTSPQRPKPHHGLQRHSSGFSIIDADFKITNLTAIRNIIMNRDKMVG